MGKEPRKIKRAVKLQCKSAPEQKKEGGRVGWKCPSLPCTLRKAWQGQQELMKTRSVGSQRISVSPRNGPTLISLPCNRYLSTNAGMDFRTRQLRPLVNCALCRWRSARQTVLGATEHTTSNFHYGPSLPSCRCFPIPIGQLRSWVSRKRQ